MLLVKGVLMTEIERWKTPRRCSNCLADKLTNYLWAQKWGKDDLGITQYKLDCLKCGFHEYSKWDGK